MCLVACGAKQADDVARAPATIALGDCVESSTTLFVSGPRPVARGDEVDPADGGGSGATGFGRIGHASGGGYGIGYSGASHNSALPTTSIGQPVSNGDLDKAIIRRYIKHNLAKIGYCYEHELLAHPSIEGTITVSFFITPMGSVKGAQGTGFDTTVANCVADVIGNIEFPKPNGGGGVQVNYPFTFHTASASPQ